MSDDAVLVDAVLNSDGRAFNELIDRYKNRVYSVCLSVVGDFDLAEDMAQEAFIEAFQRLPTLTDTTRFGNWLRVIAMNKCRMHLRRRKSTHNMEDALRRTAPPVSESLLPADRQYTQKMERQQHEDMKQATLTALDRLSEPNRQALTMHYLGGVSIKEVGRALGTSTQTAKMRIYRARKQLKKETLNMVTDTLRKQELPTDFKDRFQTGDITIFFSDISGFARITKNFPPDVWIESLYEYMTEMTDILVQYEGTLDNYEGDSMMGIFGAPKIFDDHAVKACLAALDMQARLDVLNAQWAKKDKPVLNTKIGLNSGTTIVGHFGSRHKERFSAIGDNANIAWRMEELNGTFGTRILITGATCEAAKNAVEVRKIDEISLHSGQVPLVVYELLARKGELDDHKKAVIEQYNTGLGHYEAEAWEAGLAAFEKALAIDPEDGPSKVYKTRCETGLFSLSPVWVQTAPPEGAMVVPEEEAPPVVKYVNLLLMGAAQRRATELSLTPDDKKVLVETTTPDGAVDGEPLSTRIYASLLDRIRTIADIDPASKSQASGQTIMHFGPTALGVTVNLDIRITPDNRVVITFHYTP